MTFSNRNPCEIGLAIPSVHTRATSLTRFTHALTFRVSMCLSEIADEAHTFRCYDVSRAHEYRPDMRLRSAYH